MALTDNETELMNPHATAPSGAPLFRMNGLGNEIVVLDLRGRQRTADGALARDIGARPGWRFDQLMTLHDAPSPAAAARVTIHNIDGSEAGACGNGMRCVAHVLLPAEAGARTVVETRAGLLGCRREGPLAYTVDMGLPRLDWRDIPLARAVQDTLHVPLDTESLAAGLPGDFTAVSMGNPHAVFFVDDVEAHDLARVGPLLEHDPLFPERANISLASVTTREALVLKVWERGAGLTRACGSGACAAAVAAVRRGLTGRRVTVTLPGGDLTIDWRDDGHVWMTGPVELERTATLGDALGEVAA
jgi:diaminopimelate epimerase